MKKKKLVLKPNKSYGMLNIVINELEEELKEDGEPGFTQEEYDKCCKLYEWLYDKTMQMFYTALRDNIIGEYYKYW